MNTLFCKRINEVASLIDQMNTELLSDRIKVAIDILVDALKVRRPVLICGNGGSSSDATHIAGELVGRFMRDRPAYNVIALSVNTSVITAWANDYDYESVFSRQVEAHGQAGAVLWGISTSGNSSNVLRAMSIAREMGMNTIGLTGAGGGKMAALCDVLLDVPSDITPRIQEMHIVIYHFICEQIEAKLG